jgi:hypothetical protein
VLDHTNDIVADRVAALVRKILDREEINKPSDPMMTCAKADCPQSA